MIFFLFFPLVLIKFNRMMRRTLLSVLSSEARRRRKRKRKRESIFLNEHSVHVSSTMLLPQV